jgi:hypothetical protein
MNEDGEEKEHGWAKKCEKKDATEGAEHVSSHGSMT